MCRYESRSTGRVFFRNRQTGETQWTRPVPLLVPTSAFVFNEEDLRTSTSESEVIVAQQNTSTTKLPSSSMELLLRKVDGAVLKDTSSRVPNEDWSPKSANLSEKVQYCMSGNWVADIGTGPWKMWLNITSASASLVSGSYSGVMGFYELSNSSSPEQEIKKQELVFSRFAIVGSKICGSGSDRVGTFELSGTAVGENLRFIQMYETHSVRYEGKMQKAVEGERLGDNEMWGDLSKVATLSSEKMPTAASKAKEHTNVYEPGYIGLEITDKIPHSVRHTEIRTCTYAHTHKKSTDTHTRCDTYTYTYMHTQIKIHRHTRRPHTYKRTTANVHTYIYTNKCARIRMFAHARTHVNPHAITSADDSWQCVFVSGCDHKRSCRHKFCSAK